jgi:hypothetical protein
MGRWRAGAAPAIAELEDRADLGDVTELGRDHRGGSGRGGELLALAVASPALTWPRSHTARTYASRARTLVTSAADA